MKLHLMVTVFLIPDALPEKTCKQWVSGTLENSFSAICKVKPPNDVIE
ncbi:MAG: hypothetical protein M3Q95_03255 [Bacteroidota bacterium]|nr:hypothetical protein [Bacteroidota bacterium]